MSDPQLMMRYSTDGGHTWSAEVWHTLGPEGDYERRIIYDQFGSGYQFILEETFTDNRSITFISMHGDLSLGT